MSSPQSRIKSWAAELGFDECRIARASAASHAPEFRNWLTNGHHATMAWLARAPERRCDPRLVLPGCQSVICLALNYFPGRHPVARASCPEPSVLRPLTGKQASSLLGKTARPACPPMKRQAGSPSAKTGGTARLSSPNAPALPPNRQDRTSSPEPNKSSAPPPPGFRIARYAWNDDYHDLIAHRLRTFDTRLQALGGTQKPYADTGPVLERDFATDAGLGWNGKSTMQIHPRLGTWFFLAEILTTLDLQPDDPLIDHCGNCTRCLTACPTQAIIAPRQSDARRCISYLTIENPGPIPLEFRLAIGDRIYGCDACLDVCPWNRFATLSREAVFHARHSIFARRLRDFLDLDDPAFRTLFAKSPIKRLKLPRFLRNVSVALGNTGTLDDLPALARTAASSDPLVSEHARWAAAEITTRQPTIFP